LFAFRLVIIIIKTNTEHLTLSLVRISILISLSYHAGYLSNQIVFGDVQDVIETDVIFENLCPFLLSYKKSSGSGIQVDLQHLKRDFMTAVVEKRQKLFKLLQRVLAVTTVKFLGEDMPTNYINCNYNNICLVSH